MQFVFSLGDYAKKIAFAEFKISSTNIIHNSMEVINYDKPEVTVILPFLLEKNSKSNTFNPNR